MSDVPYFYGEKVRVNIAVTCPKLDEVSRIWFAQDPEIVPPGVEGIFVKRTYRPLLGACNLIRITFPSFVGWCYLCDHEIEVIT